MAQNNMESGAVSVFCESIAVMLAAGIQTEDALGLLSENTNDAAFQNTCDGVYRGLIEQKPLADAMAATGAFPEGGVAAQARQSLTNVKAVLEAAGSGMDKVVKTVVFLKDMNDFAAMNAVYAEFFPEGGYPARSAVEVARLPKDALVEIEAVAHL